MKTYIIEYRKAGTTEWKYDEMEGEWKERYLACQRAGHLAGCYGQGMEFRVSVCTGE